MESKTGAGRYVRLCSCPPNHINCLNAKEWLKNQLGVWQFNYEGRDIRDKKQHPATVPIALAKKFISLFTHEGEYWGFLEVAPTRQPRPENYL